MYQYIVQDWFEDQSMIVPSPSSISWVELACRPALYLPSPAASFVPVPGADSGRSGGGFTPAPHGTGANAPPSMLEGDLSNKDQIDKNMLEKYSIF